ncbi:MAG: CHASE2 domain-containing protein [Limisphaerales bacterium]
MPRERHPQPGIHSRRGQRPGHLRSIVAPTLIGVFIALVSLFLLHPSSIPGSSLSRASYDLTLRVLDHPSPPTTDTSPLLVVYVDRRTFDTLGLAPSKPLDRSWHARLLQRLRRARSSIVLFDIVFDQPAPNREADQLLAQAIRDHGQVILGAEWHSSDLTLPNSPKVAIRSLSYPTSNLLAAASGHGFVFSLVDPDFTVRRHFSGFRDRAIPSLSWEAARRLELPVTTDPRLTDLPRWMNYYGPPLALPHVSFADALDPAITPDALFRDRIILVGARPTIGGFDERRDEWRNPLSRLGRGSPFMPAAEVHATELLNLVRSDWLWRLSPATESTAACLIAVALAFLVVPLRPPRLAAAAVAAEISLLFGVAYVANAHRLWIPWLIPAAIQIPAAISGSFLVHSVSWYRQRRRFLASIREQAALLDKAQDAILVLDHEGVPTYANPRARALYGWTHALPGEPGPREPTPPGDRNPAISQPDTGQQPGSPLQVEAPPSPTPSLREVLLATRHDGEWTGELHQRNAQGQPIVVECRATLIRNPGDPDPHPRFLFINTDVTERKRLQEQFLRTQRRESIGALAGGMAHDLNNALAPILMGIQTLRARSQDAATRRMLDIMENHTQRGAGMVRQVLLFARGQATASSPLQIRTLLNELHDLLRHSLPRDITLTVLAPDDLWPIQANPVQLQQVLLNLCLNARDAMPHGGRLTLAADNAELDHSEISDLPALRPGRHVMILVSDTGTGMPPEVLSHLFEPFFTTKPPGAGTGLGLATVASLVKAHGGDLRVNSHPGQGSTFEIYLPVPAPASPQSPAEPARGRGEFVLVVDDELSIRDLLREGLLAHGYRVLTASHPMEALSLARRHAERLSLVITGPGPGPTPGLSLAAILRREYPSLPLVIVTERADAAHPLDDGPGPTPPVLTKPFRLEDLLAQVHRVLNAQPDP